MYVIVRHFELKLEKLHADYFNYRYLMLIWLIVSTKMTYHICSENK